MNSKLEIASGSLSGCSQLLEGITSPCAQNYNEADRNAAGFPIEAFPPWLRAIIIQLAIVYQCPVCLPAMSILGVLSGAIGKSFKLKNGYKDKTTCLNIYVLAIAERGTGKGNIGEALALPLNQGSGKLHADSKSQSAGIKGMAGTFRKEIANLEGEAARATGEKKAEIYERLKECHVQLDRIKNCEGREITLVAGDATSEALGKLLGDNNGSMFTFSTEAGQVVRVVLGRYAEKGDVDLMLSGYSGDTVRINRISRPSIHLESPCVSMLWMAQTVIMIELIGDREAVSRGLTARMLIFDSDARRECDDRKDLSFDQAPVWNAFIEKILFHRLNSSEPTVLVATREAREVFCKMHDHSVLLMANQGDLDGEVSRWRENSIKVAGLLAVADGAEVVTESHAKAAVEIVKWCGNNYLEFHKNAIKNNLEGQRDKVVALLKATPGGQLCLSDLQKRHNITRVEFTKLVQSFPTIFEITKGTSSSVGGRPGEFAKLK